MKTMVIAVAGLLTVSSPSWAGDPIPGVDVSLEQIPGPQFANSAACTAVEGARIVVAEGKTWCELPTAISHNSSRSNFSRPLAPKGKAGGKN